MDHYAPGRSQCAAISLCTQLVPPSQVPGTIRCTQETGTPGEQGVTGCDCDESQEGQGEGVKGEGEGGVE